jgi:hypothetical protein
MSHSLFEGYIQNDIGAIDCEPFELLVGIICGSIKQISPLLTDLETLSSASFIQKLTVYLLANGCSSFELRQFLNADFEFTEKFSFLIIDSESNDLLPIGAARTRLQREIGRDMSDTNRVAWILDDDMRIPEPAVRYLTWLPTFRDAGVDVLIGSFSGSSPNPPLHGIRGQLHDVLENLEWLSQLDDRLILPDRSIENMKFRRKYPDYYYDLSRKHTAHLHETMWIEPGTEVHTVADAKKFIIEEFPRLLSSEPYIRPLVSTLPENPLREAMQSCNRGGNTFIFNPNALTDTPNYVLMSDGKEARRSDMLWAIVNTYIKGMDIRAVSFPVHHHRTVGNSTTLNIEKTIAEVQGAGLYAGLLKCLESSQDGLSCENVYAEMKEYIHQRMSLYDINFSATRDLLMKLRSKHPELYRHQVAIFAELDNWVHSEMLRKISAGVQNVKSIDVEYFLESSGLL